MLANVDRRGFGYKFVESPASGACVAGTLLAVDVATGSAGKLPSDLRFDGSGTWFGSIDVLAFDCTFGGGGAGICGRFMTFGSKHLGDGGTLSMLAFTFSVD